MISKREKNAADMTVEEFAQHIKMLSDASQIAWGANGEILLTHEHDRGLKISHNGGGDPDLILNNMF